MLEAAEPRWIQYDAKKLEAINHAAEMFWLDWPAAAYEIAKRVQEALSINSNRNEAPVGVWTNAETSGPIR
jgi:hypothetical protein